MSWKLAFSICALMLSISALVLNIMVAVQNAKHQRMYEEMEKKKNEKS